MRVKIFIAIGTLLNDDVAGLDEAWARACLVQEPIAFFR